MLPPVATPSFPYRMLGLVGEGAMGQVFRAEDIELGRAVAIKSVKPTFLASLPASAAQEAMQRFLQEARAAAALSHAGVTTVYRVGTEQGIPYIAMEWLEGQTLEGLLAARGTLDLPSVARIGLQVLDALDAAHRAGIVHRDIKPGNLMITPDGRVKVTDFGIARVEGSSLAHTQAGIVLGTPQYAAPEQLAGHPVDGRADLYALATVLYELLTGRPPFEGKSVYELIVRVQTTVAPPASSRWPGVPPAMDTFLARGLARQPNERFADAESMARALQPFLTAEGSSRAAIATDGVLASDPGVTRRRQTADWSPQGTEPTLFARPTLVVRGRQTIGIVAEVVRQWPARALGRQQTPDLLDRLQSRPLHAPAFSGGVSLAGTLLLICDGVLLAAVDPESGVTGDLALEALPLATAATLHPCPETVEPRLVGLLASLLSPPRPRLAGLDAALVDVPRLVDRLASEAFDGVVRFSGGDRLGFVFLSRGARVLDVFGDGWADDPTAAPWESWLARAGAVVGVEDRQVSFPASTFRRQLGDLCLDVVRAAGHSKERPSKEVQPAAIRVDTRADAEALRLHPRVDAAADKVSGTTLRSMFEDDPAAGLARWLLVDVEHQFEQYRRTPRWRALIEPLADIASVRLHHAPATDEARVGAFDAVTYDAAVRPIHVLERIAAGTPEAVEAFVRRLVLAKSGQGPARHLTAAVLVAPSFTEAALDTYLEALRRSRKGSLRAALDFLSHREGYLTVGRDGCHLLLVEEVDGRRRPLVPEH